MSKNEVWRTAHCLVKGLKHERNNLPNQDFVNVYSDNKCVIAALSDGVSSCAHSQVASKKAVEVTLDFFRRLLKNPKIVGVLAKNKMNEDQRKLIASAIIKEICTELRGVPDADATLAFVFVVKALNFAFIGVLGDSCVCLFEKDNTTVITQGKSYANGGTETIRNKNAADMIQTQCVDLTSVSAIMLSSDGLEDVVYSKNEENGFVLKPAEKFVNMAFEQNSTSRLTQMVSQMRSEGGTYDDDISMAVIARAPVQLSQEPTWLCTCGARNIYLAVTCEHCGCDFYKLYSDSPIDSFNNSARDMFLYYNAHPEEERRLIGLKAEHDYTAFEEDTEKMQRPKPKVDNKQSPAQSRGDNRVRKCSKALLKTSVIACILVFLYLCLSAINTINKQTEQIDNLTTQVENLSAEVGQLTQLVSTSTEPPQEEYTEPQDVLVIEDATQFVVADDTTPTEAQTTQEFVVDEYTQQPTQIY